MNHHEESFKGSGDLKLYYQKWVPDSESRAVIALVHGIGEHSGRYMNVVNHFVPLGYTIYGIDHRGHGKSEGKRGHIMTWSEYRNDIHAYIQIIQKECDRQPVFILGHSLGGLITLDYCLHHPGGLKAAIVSSPALAKPGIPAILLFISKMMSKIWPGLTIETKLEIEAISRDPKVIQEYQDDPLVHGMASARLGTEFENCRLNTLANANKFNLPVLIYHGKDDRVVSPKGSIKFFDALTIEDKDIHLIEGGYHEPHNDIEMEKLFTIIEEWITKYI